MRHTVSFPAIVATLLLLGSLSSCQPNVTSPAMPVTPDEAALGKLIFFDSTLSNPAGQACAGCHDPGAAFSDPNHAIVSPGVIPGRAADRNAPAITYSSFCPENCVWSPADRSYKGGFFDDGRSPTLEDQAAHPFLGGPEMNDTSKSQVIAKLRTRPYFSQFAQIFGPVDDTDAVYREMTQAIAAFERSDELHPFTSKFDYYLLGQATLTDQEMRGMKLFSDSTKGNCASCHLMTPDPASGRILFTDFTYANNGVPRNLNDPFYTEPPSINPAGLNFIDSGLGSVLHDRSQIGAFKVPSLRNVAITAPYFHNGYFNTLQQVVHFYNIRDSAMHAGILPPAECPVNVDTTDMGHLGLSTQNEEDIVAFLNTLTDGYKK
ncbi:MAG TPA: cytochrome c peroxidase [Candidatus Kapabacteria bacterium]|nr:cytochrome c peroxidase [Candidatus Kapabacteria bacterium]